MEHKIRLLRIGNRKIGYRDKKMPRKKLIKNRLNKKITQPRIKLAKDNRKDELSKAVQFKVHEKY
jgi:hypothetical protein